MRKASLLNRESLFTYQTPHRPTPPFPSCVHCHRLAATCTKVMLSMKAGMTPEEQEEVLRPMRAKLPPGVQIVLTEQQDFKVARGHWALRVCACSRPC